MIPSILVTVLRGSLPPTTGNSKLSKNGFDSTGIGPVYKCCFDLATFPFAGAGDSLVRLSRNESHRREFMDTIVGIDLGTTNSEVAVIRDGQPVVLEEDGDPILPSVVGLDPAGPPARRQGGPQPVRARPGADHQVDQAEDGPGRQGRRSATRSTARRRSRR